MGKQAGGRGEVIVFTGLGTGKTTAALGIALRTIAHGGKVIFINLTGPQRPVAGEVRAAATLGSKLLMIGIKTEAENISCPDGFTESVDTVKHALVMTRDRWLGEGDLVILDDISPCLDRSNMAQFAAILDNRPPDTSIILTGTSIPEPIIQKADLVTEFLKIK